MMLFEYMIGNTDFSIWALHNVRIVQKPDAHAAIAVPYDFDLSGLVHAPYATPDRRLGLRSVVDRLYRGPCRTHRRVRRRRGARSAPSATDMLALIDSMHGSRSSSRRGEMKDYLESVLQVDREAGVDQEDVRRRLQAAADDVEGGSQKWSGSDWRVRTTLTSSTPYLPSSRLRLRRAPRLQPAARRRSSRSRSSSLPTSDRPTARPSSDPD